MSLDRVPGAGELYIGGLISMRRHEALKKANITHVVSVLRLPLERELFVKYKHLVVELDDLDEEDIIQHFATSNAFIKEGLGNGGGVLVHCAMGKSRSATLVIAYLLTLSPSTTPNSALESVRTVREFVEPNEGFMEQLELYHRMGAPVDVATQPQYQRWLYQREVEASVACGKAPDAVRFEDEVDAGDNSKSELEYRCRKCRRSLAISTYVVIHEPKAPLAGQSTQTGPISSLSKTLSAPPTPQCAHLFLDPLSWMRPELEQGKFEGRLECPNPKCKSNVGKYAWQGMRCSCGKWVNPGIALARGRVDEVKSRARAPAGGLGGKM